MLSSNASDKEPCVDRKTPDKEFPEYEKGFSGADTKDSFKAAQTERVI